MRVLVASETGMCFGVRKALDVAEAVDAPGDVAVHGELVHNPLVTERLRRRGLLQTPEDNRSELSERPALLITAHGISDRERGRLREAGKRLIDTTCPLVSLVHRKAQEFAEDGRLVIVVGRKGHVEVLGITEDLEDFRVVTEAADVGDWGGRPLGVVSQSTTEPGRFQRMVSVIECQNPGSDIRIADTICSPTRNRQRALAELVTQVEALVVVGDKSSNNTRALARRGEEAGLPTCLVGSAAELDSDWLSGFSVVGLAAGTSALDESLEEVRVALLACSPASPLGQDHEGVRTA